MNRLPDDRKSWALQFSELPPDERSARLARLTPAQQEFLRWCWPFWARPQQLSPWSAARGKRDRDAALERYRIWLLLGGRGSGKTRPAAETVIEEAKIGGEGYRIALVGRTRADPRDVMIEGESGILPHSPPDFRPTYYPSLRKLEWPNGALAFTYSADEDGDQLRGPQHHFAWGDEIAAWRNLAAWDSLLFGLRLGEYPRVVGSTTPKPRQLLRELVKDPKCLTSRMSMLDNQANLPETFIRDVLDRYKGTRLEREQVHGELLDEAPGALWNRSLLETTRVEKAPELRRIVVGVDPSVADPNKSEEPCECGIVIAGLGADGHGYVLADLSGVLSPDAWAKRTARAFAEWGANAVIAEGNNGGELVRLVIQGANSGIPVRIVHAAVGKVARAEPIVMRFEQQRAHIVGVKRDLEDQLCSWTPGTKSPDRLDAMVWALTELLGGNSGLVTDMRLDCPPHRSRWTSGGNGRSELDRFLAEELDDEDSAQMSRHPLATDD